MTPTVRMNVSWSVPHGESRPIVSALQELMLATRAEAGCVGCSLSTDARKHKKIVINYTEEWIREADLVRQLRSDRFSALAELMERSSEYPNVEFVLPGTVRGVEYAAEVRGFEEG